MDTRALAVLAVSTAALSLAACQADYVHVVVESASSELVGAPWQVSVHAFGDGHGVSHEYQTFFRDGPPLYSTDFNLVLDDAPDTLDLRVGVPTAPSRWAGDRVVRPPGDGRDLHILLYIGETPLATARTAGGDLITLTRFTTGLAMTWLASDGVALRTVRMPDATVVRPIIIDPDTAAKKLRTASRPNSNGFGADRFVVSWIGGDGAARLFVQTDTDTEPRPVVRLITADDIWSAVAPVGGTFTLATATAGGGELRLTWYDGDGTPLGDGRVAVAGGLRRIRGFVVGPGDAMILAVENLQGATTLIRQGPDGAARTAPVAEIDALALAADQARLLTVQRDQDLFVQTLGLDGGQAGERHVIADASRVPVGLFGGVSIGPCAVVWPEYRDDGTRPAAIDLRAWDLDNVGTPLRSARLAHGEVGGNHFAPTVACMSSSLAYATFLVSGPTDTSGDLKLRKIPSAPIE